MPGQHPDKSNTLIPTTMFNLNLKARFLRLIARLRRQFSPQPTNIIQFTPAPTPLPPPETVDAYLRRTGMTLIVDDVKIGRDAPEIEVPAAA